MLIVKNLNKSFSNIHVLRDVSFSIALGKICALTGANGCGKTTFLKCLSGLVNYESGSVEFKSMSNFLFLSDKNNIFGDLTIEENLNVICRYRNQNFDKDVFNESLQRLDIKNLSTLPLKYFSQGNLQRNKLCIAMNLGWDYLFIDEPFSNLDSNGIQVFKEVFTTLKLQNKTIIFSTHHLDESRSICDNMISIENTTITNYAI
tara:strand:+ start:6458 stop:7069 length:612 start_codon:yes stop_codon:yes gene_type:complete